MLQAMAPCWADPRVFVLHVQPDNRNFLLDEDSQECQKRKKSFTHHGLVLSRLGPPLLGGPNSMCKKKKKKKSIHVYSVEMEEIDYKLNGLLFVITCAYSNDASTLSVFLVDQLQWMLARKETKRFIDFPLLMNESKSSLAFLLHYRLH